MEQGTVRIMEIADEINKAWGGGRHDEALSLATNLAGQLGYAVPMGTGAASPEALVNAGDDKIIIDLAVNTNSDGTYTGDRGSVAEMATDTGTDQTV